MFEAEYGSIVEFQHLEMHEKINLQLPVSSPYVLVKYISTCLIFISSFCFSASWRGFERRNCGKTSYVHT